MSLQIGQYIQFALGEKNATYLWHKIDGRVAPVVQPEDDQNQLPYIWYYSESMTEASTKDGHMSDTCNVQIEVVAPTYGMLLDLLQLVRQAMDAAPNNWALEEYTPFRILDQSLQAGPEEYDDIQQSYCRRLNYTIETYELH